MIRIPARRLARARFSDATITMPALRAIGFRRPKEYAIRSILNRIFSTAAEFPFLATRTKELCLHFPQAAIPT
jgi:hypothetical protein